MNFPEAVYKKYEQKAKENHTTVEQEIVKRVDRKINYDDPVFKIDQYAFEDDPHVGQDHDHHLYGAKKIKP
ncbi:MAG: hypothetical protein JNM63_14675 [Spirochaetia bacterium]|nr:hypothetical protein [Spirochaetia bacterium]